MTKIYTIIAFLLVAVQSFGQNSLQQKAEALAGGEVFCNAAVGIKVTTGGGDILAEHNSRKMFTPASNMKLISTGVALHSLGADYRFRTQIAYDGHISDGVLHGNLYIVGGADPVTGSKDTVATALTETFKGWEKVLRAAGIGAIEGHIVGDGRWLDGMMEEPTWLWEDVGTYYGSGVSGLNFYENMISFNANVRFSDNKAGLELNQTYPQTSWMDIRKECTVGEKSSGDRLYMYTSDLAPVAVIRGTYGIDRGKKRVDFSNKFPEYTCAVYFKNYLAQRGITCTGGAADFKLKREWMPAKALADSLPEGIGTDGDSLKIIGCTLSPSLARIVRKTNYESNNLCAETLLRTLGKELKGKSSYEIARLAMNDIINSMGMSSRQSEGIRIQDGSGLSRQNLISPDFMCGFLAAMMDSPCFEDYLWSLPYPGGDGSLSYNMKEYDPSLRRRIRVKSGSMNGVRCYSGYILPADFHLPPDGSSPEAFGQIPQQVKDRIIIFSIMTNNCTSPTWKVRPELDKFMGELAGDH
ncbi:MAG: hypothetical protein E7111_08290 [Bacteroidales bacterium]|nr:hypothetical protein [Bacteroidales bacterium]